MSIQIHVLIVLSTFIINSGIVQAQKKQNELKQRRVTYLSKQMGVSESVAARIVSAVDEYKDAANKIYHDSTLTSAMKLQRLKENDEQKEVKLDAVIPVEARQRQKGKSGFLKLTRKQ